MKPNEKFDRTTAKIHIPNGSAERSLQRNPVISRSRRKLYTESKDTDVISSITIEFLQLSIRKEVDHSRIMAWDNQCIFGPYPKTTSTTQNGDFEAE